MQSVVFIFLFIFGGQVSKSEGYRNALWYQYFELCNAIRTHPEQHSIPCSCPPRTEDLTPFLSGNRFNNANQTVIPKSWLCNYIDECPNGSDEKYCICKESEYKCGCPLRTQKCHYGQGCYSESDICNGRLDCMDGTDELNCNCPNGNFRCACQDNNTCSYPEVCILEHQTCDGKSDCSDGSDEAECQCAGEFSCGCHYVNGKCLDPTSCIPLASKCDGINDCIDGSDELECEFAGIPFYCAFARNGSCELRLPVYVPWEFVCNRNNDCGDWSDEVNCQCVDGQFKCNCNQVGCASSPGCLDTNLKVCDGIDDCGDFSDETNCSFASEVFTCNCFANGQACSSKVTNVQMHKVCDGFYDCSDHSDERFCTCGMKFECKCARSGSDSCAGDNWCINEWQVCNGYKDCADGSDEKDCSWPDYWFVCYCVYDSSCTGNFLASEWYVIACNGENDCGDWSDEQYCYSCPLDLFQCDCYSWFGANCTNYAGCVEQSKVCDRINDCGDWSDERNCSYFHCDCSSFETPTLCYAGSVKEEKRCNLVNDCGDWSDERNCLCPENDFVCPCDDCGLLPSCVKSSDVCDGVNDCGDWSDERDCVCLNGKTQCCQQNATDACPSDAACIWKYQFCDGANDCGDWSDEKGCNCKSYQARCGCIFDESNCDTQQKCIDLLSINDGVVDCDGGDDETCITLSISFSFSCSCHTMYCPDAKTRDQMLQYTAITMNGSTTICHPVASKTYFNGTTGVKEPEWACVSSMCDTDLCRMPFVCDNKEVTVAHMFCHGYFTCSVMSDLSDDNLGFRCPTGFSGSACVLPQINLYDEIAHCSDASDLCFVDGKMSCFECFDKKLIISPKQVCDGVVDCYDVSDECFCADQSVCKEVLGTSRTRCPSGHFYCNENLGCVDETAGMCNEFVNCTNYANTARCWGYGFYRRTTITCHNTFGKIQATMCDGRPECKDLSDECDTCPDKPLFCNDPCRLYMDGERYCNGENEDLVLSVDDCPPGFDEKNCTMRFYCKSGSSVSIDVDKTCDGLIDCQNAEDEAQSLCSSTRFYCLEKTPISVDKSQVEDGKRDCADGSDECPPDNSNATIFSSQYELIGNQFILAIFWVMALVSIAGNAAVLATTAKEMLTWDKPSVAMQYNSLFVLNLSLSDFCMGLYLLVVCIKAAQFSGSYCFHDKPWRTSAFCSYLGALVVFSTEASVFIMTAMTTFRVITIMRPFITRTLTIIWGRIAIVSCWILAISISTLPLFISDNYFASGVWFPNYFYKTDQISKTELRTLARRMGQHNLSTWFETKQFVKSKIPYLPILGDIGYYGETSVCMPRIFVNVGDAGWAYSAFIMFLNFALFLYMVICYVVIYRKSTNNIGKSGKRSKKMQSRISRIVFTDFACWVPLCTLAFVQLTGASLPVVVYAVSAGVLLPINSALNPLIYSDIVSGVISKVYNFCRLTVSRHQTSE